VTLKWHKELTDSDAQQDTQGAKMPFLRFTQSGHDIDHTTWFREVFFADAAWKPGISRQGQNIEETEVDVHVVILGRDLGQRLLHIDHNPARAKNHNAPTTHLHYDNATRSVLEAQNLTGYTVTVEKANGAYSLVVE
jgi:hypothetical protein